MNATRKKLIVVTIVTVEIDRDLFDAEYYATASDEEIRDFVKAEINDAAEMRFAQQPFATIVP
jgi:hypothetical protein